MAIGSDPQKCNVSGHDICYYREGSGEVIVLLHGITTYSFIWRKIFPALSKKYDVIALDLLGCGDSQKPLDVSYSIKAHAERLHTMLTTLGVKRFHIVGHDLGGGIAQIFSVDYPELLHNVTLINSVAYDFWPVQPISALRTPIVRQFLMASVDFGAFSLIVKKGLFHKERATPELMERFLAPLQTSAGRKAFLHFAKCLDNHNLMDISQRLRELKLPVLIIRGDADSYLSLAIAKKLHSEIPGSQLIRIATASHFAQEDEPQTIIDALSQFFQEV